MRARDQVWSPDDRRVHAAAPSERVRLGFMLMRTRCNACRMWAMTRGQVEERDGCLFILLRQQKTKDRRVAAVPVHRDLERLKGAPALLTSRVVIAVRARRGALVSTQRKWDTTMASRCAAHATVPAGWSKDKACRACWQHRQRRDLRRTGVVRMAEAGVTTPQMLRWPGGRSTTRSELWTRIAPPRRSRACRHLTREASGVSAPTGNVMCLSFATPSAKKDVSRCD
jgi:hypothetical protein